jgi:hypothetical protein
MPASKIGSRHAELKRMVKNHPNTYTEAVKRIANKQFIVRSSHHCRRLGIKHREAFQWRQHHSDNDDALKQ